MTLYNSLSEEEEKQVKEILFLLDQFCVGHSFFHELTMITDGLPKTYLIQQCRANLDKLCHIDSLPGKALERKTTSDEIKIKVNGDGARMTRNLNFALMSFSIVQTGDQVMTAKRNRTLAIHNGKEDLSQKIIWKHFYRN